LADECEIWKNIFVNGNGFVLIPSRKFKTSENTFNLLSKRIEELRGAHQKDIAKSCYYNKSRATKVSLLNP
jgi:hypothetical protein